MLGEKCCVCGKEDWDLIVLFEAHAVRGPSVYSCPNHWRSEIVRAEGVFSRLRSVETEYYIQHRENPVAVVWASTALAGLEDKHTTARLPDGLPVLMVMGEASPEVYAVGRFLASTLGCVEEYEGRVRQAVVGVLSLPGGDLVEVQRRNK